MLFLIVDRLTFPESMYLDDHLFNDNALKRPGRYAFYIYGRLSIRI